MEESQLDKNKHNKQNQQKIQSANNPTNSHTPQPSKTHNLPLQNPKPELLIPSRTPSNIMIKSSFLQYQSKEPLYITESILELYNYIMNITPTDLETVEIEAKFGFFDFHGACVQSFKEIKDTFKIPLYNKLEKTYNHFRYDFNSGLEENQFYTLWYFVQEECDRKNSEIIQLEPINYKETHFKSGTRRSIVFKNNTPIKEELINKKDKHHINIRNNGKDFRITSCREEKVTGISFDDMPTGYREKFRTSYKFRFFRLDFTIVTSYKDLDASSFKDISYEVELEFEELNTFITKEFKSFDDFKTMFLRFIQNVFCIYELLTPDYYYYNEYNKRPKEGSLFGDYMKKNVLNK